MALSTLAQRRSSARAACFVALAVAAAPALMAPAAVAGPTGASIPAPQVIAPTGVSGTVTEQGSGTPLSGAWVVLMRTADFSIAGGAVADAGGNYAATVNPGSYVEYVIDPAGAHAAGFLGAPTTLTVTTGSTVDADPTLAATRGSITGTVREAGNGTPVGGAWALALSGTTGAPEVGVTADAFGRFALRGLSPGPHFVAYLDRTGGHASGFHPSAPDVARATAVTVTPGSSPVADGTIAPQAVLSGPTPISGTLTDRVSAAAIPGVSVLAMRASDFRMVSAVTTNGSGAYSLAVPAGDYKLAFIDPSGGHAMQWHDDQPASGIAGAASVRAPATINASLAPTRGSAAGTITDQRTGAPVAGAWVAAIGPTGVAGGAVTGADGHYSIAGLPPSTYRAAILDPTGGRTLEYWDDAASYQTATAFTVEAGRSTTADAALAFQANDDFADAQVLAGTSGTVTGTSLGATKQSGEDDHAGQSGGRSVWYRWTAPSAGTATFDLCDSDFDTLLGVYKGTAVNDLLPVVANDDACGLRSRASFRVVSGTTYRIAVDGSFGAGGHIALRWSLDNPPSFASTWGTRPAGNGQLDEPHAAAVDASGNVYVVDTRNNRVEKFNSAGTYVSQWGGSGTGNGQFDGPEGIAISGSSVYVVDSGNHRVQRFNTSGTFQSAWGAEGAANGQFELPHGIATDTAGNIYVADTGNNRIQRFNPASSANTFATRFGTVGSDNGEVVGPEGVAVDASGNVYVADTGNNRVERFSPASTSHAYVSQWGSLGAGDGELSSPAGVAVSATGSVYVVDTGNNRVQRFDAAGTYQSQWGTSGTGESRLERPRGLAIDGSGNVYVVDTAKNRVRKYTPSGASVNPQFGVGANALGQFERPAGASVDAAGNVYVADAGNSRIEKFSATDAFLTTWGAAGTADNRFDSPQGVAVSRSGEVFVTDSGNNRVVVYSSTGTFLRKWGTTGSATGQFVGPAGIAVDAAGAVYVVDRGNDRVQKFDANGTFQTAWGTTGSGVGQFDEPLGIAVDTAGSVYVADAANDRVQRFTTSGVYVTSWGVFGDGNGEMIPAWITTGGSTAVYVTDVANDRVQRFTPNGSFVTAWGSPGETNGRFDVPQGVALAPGGGSIYVVDRNNHRVQRFTIN